jgi:hypothetical protein
VIDERGTLARWFRYGSSSFRATRLVALVSSFITSDDGDETQNVPSHTIDHRLRVPGLVENDEFAIKYRGLGVDLRRKGERDLAKPFVVEVIPADEVAQSTLDVRDGAEAGSPLV